MRHGAVVVRLACVATAVAALATVAPPRMAAAGEVSSLADLGSSSNHSANEMLQGPRRHLLGENFYRVPVAL